MLYHLNLNDKKEFPAGLRIDLIDSQMLHKYICESNRIMCRSQTCRDLKLPHRLALRRIMNLIMQDRCFRKPMLTNVAGTMVILETIIMHLHPYQE